MRLDAQLAQTLCARLCHDLGGAVGTLAGTLDLLGESDAGMLALARETASGLRQRLRLYAAAWGGAAEEADAEHLRMLLEGAPAASRVRFVLEPFSAGGPLPAALVPLALNAALLGAEALPRGGTVTLAGSAEDGFLVRPEGREAAWPPGFIALLGGCRADPAAAGPRRVLAPWLLGLAAAAGWTASLAQGAEPGAPPLVLAPA